MLKFQLQKERLIPRIGLVQKFNHPTGLEWIHINNPNKNNVFNLSFRTDIKSSMGIAHILEHTTLCGSDNYPTRDPFFKMLNRSYSNFMNALTGDDITMYPFSTVLKKDYFNLMNVYLDAALNPLLNKQDFEQEGWRLEYNDINDNKSDIVFKGVVYNEMKGALGDPSSLFYARNQQLLYEDSVYGFISGGDPKDITNLTHLDLLRFHKEKYHPSNAIIYTYGNISIEEQMDVVEAKLKKYEQIESFTDKSVNLWTSPRSKIANGPIDSMLDPSKQARVAVSFMANEDKSFKETLTMRILTDLLIDGAASPMYKSLIESKLGSDYAPTTGYNPYAHTTSVSFGLQGVPENDSETVKQRIMECLEASYSKGFPKERVESVFHQLELSMRHRTTQFGMNIGWNVLRNMVHDGDPFDSLNIEQNLVEVKKDILEPGHLESRIKKYMLDNPHRLDFVMNPDQNYGSLLAIEEQSRLDSKVSKLSETEKLIIYNDGIALSKEQEKKQDAACLPSLSLHEIPKDPIVYPTIQENLTLSNGAIDSLWRKTSTNGISYINIQFEISQIPDNLTPYLPLFCRALTSLGTRTKTLPEFDESVRLYTGGVSAFIFSQTNPQSILDQKSFLEFSGNAIDDNLEQLYSIFHQTMFETNWSAKEELFTCLKTQLSDYSNSVVGNGHVFAMRAAASGLTPSASLNEKWSGISQIKFLESLLKENDMNDLSKKLEKIAEMVFDGKVSTLVISENEDKTVHKEKLFLLLHNLKTSREIIKSKEAFVSVYGSKNHVMDVGVNYTSKTFLGVPFTHKDGPALKILSSLMSNHYLHRELREKGGAYGGGAKYSPIDGLFQFMTYRDPLGFHRTFEKYRQSIEWAFNISRNVTEKDLEHAKLNCLKSLDVPIDAGQEGLGFFHGRISVEDRKAYRERLFKADIADVERVAKTYLKNESSTAVIGELTAQ